MKKLFLLTSISMFIFAANAFALPTLDPGFNWNTSSYWTPTDLTTATNGSVFSIIFSEDASYESSFGIFTVDDVDSPTAIDTKFEIFAHTQEPMALSTVYFKYDAGSWSVTKDMYSNVWTAFDNKFGFYFDVYTGGQSDTSVDYSYYSDNQFNSPASEVGVDHILMAFNGVDMLKLFLDDQINTADRDYNDMVVVVTDVAPVPEPGTLLLLGSGIAGLAAYRRRKNA